MPPWLGAETSLLQRERRLHLFWGPWSVGLMSWAGGTKTQVYAPAQPIVPAPSGSDLPRAARPCVPPPLSTRKSQGAWPSANQGQVGREQNLEHPPGSEAQGTKREDTQ